MEIWQHVCILVVQCIVEWKCPSLCTHILLFVKWCIFMDWLRWYLGDTRPLHKQGIQECPQSSTLLFRRNKKVSPLRPCLVQGVLRGLVGIIPTGFGWNHSTHLNPSKPLKTSSWQSPTTPESHSDCLVRRFHTHRDSYIQNYTCEIDQAWQNKNWNFYLLHMPLLFR